ncbi:ABC-type transport auxiliary lipoprotein family protein [Sulfurirhabdus autotrophica]|nr:ABC-type transport auxiliary lipoprotein family protein [Sulfurirhabdus autotrophica]
MNTYALEAEFEQSAGTKNVLTLLVSKPLARPGYDGTGMVYIQKPHELNYFAKNQWVDSPAKMLAPLLVQALERRSHFRAVIQNSGSATADMRLETEIIRIQQVFLTHPSTLQMTIRAQLIDISGKKVLATKEFDVSEKAASEDPYGGVIAANLAVKNLLNQIAEFCSAYAAGIVQHP